MNNINKNFLPLFGTPMYLKLKEDLKSEKNLNLETQYKFKNFSQIEKTEYIVNGLNYLGNQYKNYLKNDLKSVLLLIQKEKLNYFIKTNLKSFSEDNISLFVPKDVNGIKYFLNSNNYNTSTTGVNKALLLFNQLYKKGILINLGLEELINLKKSEINNLKEIINNNSSSSSNNNSVTSYLNNTDSNNNSIINLNNTSSVQAQNLNGSSVVESISNLGKSNYIKIEETIKELIKNSKFDANNNTFATKSLPGFVTPRINDYIKSMTMFNMKRKGTILVYSRIIGYYFNNLNHKLLINIFNFLTSSFRSLHCLISKPVFVVTPDKIEIQLFYYFLDPKKNLKKDKWVLGASYKKKLIPSSQLSASQTSLIDDQAIYKDKIISRLIKFHFKLIKIRDKNVIIWRKNFITRNAKKLKIICDILSKFLRKPVELNLIRLRYPYNDSNILVNLLAIMIKRTKIRIFFNKLFRRAVIKNPFKINFNLKGPKKVMVLPAFLSGMKIRIAGRLLTQRVVPRKTVKTTVRGALATGKVNYSEMARITKKNKRGAFSITVTSGHNYL